jgi:hypothetical protein
MVQILNVGLTGVGRMGLGHVVGTTLFVLHFAMEGENDENQNCDEAVDNDPEDGHRSPPTCQLWAGDTFTIHLPASLRQ